MNEESEKPGVKLKIHKTKIMASSSITLWQTDEETMETVADFILEAPKSLPEKAMAPHSSTLAWKTPWTEEPGRLHAVHGVVKSQTWLSEFTFTFHFPALEKEMATHSSVLAWRIPGTGEPGGLPSMEFHRAGHD